MVGVRISIIDRIIEGKDIKKNPQDIIQVEVIRGTTIGRMEIDGDRII